MSSPEISTTPEAEGSKIETTAKPDQQFGGNFIRIKARSENGHCTGYVQDDPHSHARFAEIGYVTVESELQKKGLGAQFIRAFVYEAVRQGATELRSFPIHPATLAIFRSTFGNNAGELFEIQYDEDNKEILVPLPMSYEQGLMSLERAMEIEESLKKAGKFDEAEKVDRGFRVHIDLTNVNPE